MSFRFMSMTDSQLREHYTHLSDIMGREHRRSFLPECEIETIQSDLSFIAEILKDRTTSVAARALAISAAGASAGRAVSVSPLISSPRTTSGSIERRGASTQRSSAARLDAGSGLSSPPKTSREAALSAVEESEILVPVAAPDSEAVMVLAEHVTSAVAGDGSSSVLALSAPIPGTPTTPLSIDPMHSAFARAVSSPGTPSALPRSHAHSSLPRAISGLMLDGDGSDLPVFDGPRGVMPEMAAQAYEMPDPAREFCLEPRNRRRRGSASIIGVEFASYRGSPVPDTVTEDELTEEKRRKDEMSALPPGLSLLNYSGEDPLFSYYFRSSVRELREARNR